VLTVFVGLWYWRGLRSGGAHLAAESLANRRNVSPALGSCRALYFPLCAVPPNPWLLAVIVLVLRERRLLGICDLYPVGGDDNHVLCMASVCLGMMMLFNVWGIIWLNNKKIIFGTLAGTPPANATVLARQAFLGVRERIVSVLSAVVLYGGGEPLPNFGR